jgi:hypothetical protein
LHAGEYYGTSPSAKRPPDRRNEEGNIVGRETLFNNECMTLLVFIAILIIIFMVFLGD